MRSCDGSGRVGQEWSVLHGEARAGAAALRQSALPGKKR